MDDCGSMVDAMQINGSKSEAIERLSALRDAVEGLRSGNMRSPEFLKWYEDLTGAFKYVFGAESDEMSSLSAISYKSGFYSSNTARGEQLHNSAYQRGLDEAHAKLKSIVEQIEAYCEDDGESTQHGSQDMIFASIDTTEVFVVHGRDQGALAEVKQVLSLLGLRPVVLQDLPNQGRTIIEKFEDYADVGYAVVVCTPDDEGKAVDEDSPLRPRVRQNVLIELGYFLGVLGRDRVCALIKGEVEIPSDYSGVLYVEMDEKSAWTIRLVGELKEAGYRVDANKLF